MKKKALAAVIIAAGILAGCGSKQTNSDPVQGFVPETVPTQTESQPVEEVEKPKEFKVITERTVVDGKMQSYLTGEWKDADVVKRRNMAVMIPNNKPALPQYGISYASIIYEAPMESGSCTRLMGIFEDYDDLERIGPVRSARDYFMFESMSYDSLYCNWGLAVPYVAPVINTDKVDNISQAVQYIDSPSSEAFGRVDRGKGYATEFTGYLFTEGYTKAVKRHKYETEYTSRFVNAFTFADEGCTAEYADYPDATEIKPGGDAKSSGGYDHTNPVFEYNATDGLYYRSQLGAPQTDEYNKEQLAVSNVIFKVCNGSKRDDHGYLVFDVYGEGESYVFTNGKVIKGTWSRDRKNDYSPTVFKDEKGEEIVMNQGKTWVCIIWADYKDCISYK